jgi:hypothetical protein
MAMITTTQIKVYRTGFCRGQTVGSGVPVGTLVDAAGDGNGQAKEIQENPLKVVGTYYTLTGMAVETPG